jgi:hypothetical protein
LFPEGVAEVLGMFALTFYLVMKILWATFPGVNWL